MPPVYKGRAGSEMQWFRPGNTRDLAGYLNAGIARDMGSPVVGIAAWRLEGYGGYRSGDPDGGGRFLLEIPSFYLGAGIDWNASDRVSDFLFNLDLPLRRGGIFGRGSTLSLRWLPTRDQTLSLGVNVPLWGRNIGATRPHSDNVRLIKRKPRRLELRSYPAPLESVLVDLAERARWVARLSQPFAEPEGADPHEAMQDVLARIAAHTDSTDAHFPDGHTFPAEVEAFHTRLDLAFSRALGADKASDRGRTLANKARQVLLDEVLLPYNRLLGQRKKNDSLIGMIAVAQTEFALWTLSESGIQEEFLRPVIFVFQTLCDIMEENRAELGQRWRDARFVWLPLQYALRPEEHDTQPELVALMARAVEQPFTRENRIWYVLNEQFQWEMARSVRQAEDYHVLWVHDFRGYNGQGEPDAIAYGQTLNYLEAITARVAAYDESGKLPQYFILLDQHYFEINKARLWMRLLREPLDYTLDLPEGQRHWEQQLAEAQERLRQAVAESHLLQLAASQYGKDWLRNRIKVHINITNPADPSFFSWHVAGILPVPDNLMRDHRKIAFYDITEDEPYRGVAMFTGMGIGEHYVGASWEDRALMIQGPGALAVKDAARGLLEAQGFTPEEIPYPLRQQPVPTGNPSRLDAGHIPAATDKTDPQGLVLQLHNETGFHDKPINVAKAVLYSLMPPGSVLTIPDSLWQSYVYASLLAGSAQRGCKVLIIAPTEDSAPSAAPPTLARAHGLLGRLIVFQEGMKTALNRHDGLLKVGLYAPRQGVGDLAGRLRQAGANQPPWIRQVYPANRAARALTAQPEALLDSLGFATRYLYGDTTEELPKIHLKANFLASGTALQKLITHPEMVQVVRHHVAYLAGQISGPADDGPEPDVRNRTEELTAAWTRLVSGVLQDCSTEEREQMILFLTVGSVNMDYRSMVMDGEVMVTIAGWRALAGFMDFLLLPGLCEWVETTDQLDALLPPPSGLTRALAGLMKLAL